MYLPEQGEGGGKPVSDARQARLSWFSHQGGATWLEAGENQIAWQTKRKGVISFKSFPVQSTAVFHSQGSIAVQEEGKTRKTGSSQLVATQTGTSLLWAVEQEHPSASDTGDVEPSGPVWLDEHCNLWVGDEVRKVGRDDEGGEAGGEGGEDGEGGQFGGDDEGGEGVLGVKPVPPLLFLPIIARQEQARHTADYQVMHKYLWDTGTQ